MEKPDKQTRGYDVGRGKPPATTRFKPGQSGNRKGRPKGSKNFSTAFADELNRKIGVTESGKRRKYEKREVIARQLVNKSAEGDLKAASLVLQQMKNIESNNHAASPERFSEADRQVIAAFIHRMNLMEEEKENGE